MDQYKTVTKSIIILPKNLSLKTKFFPSTFSPLVGVVHFLPIANTLIVNTYIQISGSVKCMAMNLNHISGRYGGVK